MTVPTPTPPPAPAPVPVPVPPAPRISNTTVFVGMVVAILGLLGVYLWETAHHVDASPLLPVLLAVIGAGIPGIAALSKVGEVGANVQVVQHQTNGNISRLLSLAETMVAAQVTATAQTHSTLQQAVAAAVTTAEPAHAPADPSPADAGPPPSLATDQPR